MYVCVWCVVWDVCTEGLLHTSRDPAQAYALSHRLAVFGGSRGGILCLKTCSGHFPVCLCVSYWWTPTWSIDFCFITLLRRSRPLKKPTKGVSDLLFWLWIKNVPFKIPLGNEIICFSPFFFFESIWQEPWIRYQSRYKWKPKENSGVPATGNMRPTKGKISFDQLN